MASQPRDRPVLSGRDTLPATSLSLQPREEEEVEEGDSTPCLEEEDMEEDLEDITTEEDMVTMDLEEEEAEVGEEVTGEGSEEATEVVEIGATIK